MPVRIKDVYKIIQHDNINCEVNGRDFKIKCNSGSVPITEPVIFEKLLEDAEIKDGKLVFTKDIVSENDKVFIKDAMLEMSVLYQDYYFNAYQFTNFDDDVKRYLEENKAAPPEFKQAFLACYVAGMDTPYDYSEPDIFAVKLIENSFEYVRNEIVKNKEKAITINESDLKELFEELSITPESTKKIADFYEKNGKALEALEFLEKRQELINQEEYQDRTR